MREVLEIAVHPHQPVTYVAINHEIDFPRDRILVVDENSGGIEAPENIIGRWIRVDPSGQYLYAGCKGLYEKGVRFHMNPGWNLITTPEYGSIDWIISYELQGTKIKLSQVFTAAGGNGSGIALSADGARITYLSHVGTPSLSGNLVGWNPKNSKEQPVTYPAKDRAGTQLLAFHPTLNLVATVGGTSAVLFDREKGNVIEGKLQLTKKGLGDAKIERLLFSPDGASLVFVCSDTESGRYLRKVDLKLTAAERALAAKGVVARVAASVESVPTLKNLIKVNRNEIDALNAGEVGGALSHAEISKRYLNSVVLITSNEGSGTGFVVGRKGYILTCAHVLPKQGAITVAYPTASAGRLKSVSVSAKPVRVDVERDLALLKISAESDLPFVALAADENSCEPGEEVTVIGNPGLGDKILKHTVTTGVVSSVEREFEGQKYVQTSAAVNAGNSGGPVFGSHGQVIGLVVLKARLEATAFAVPANILRQFLQAATEEIR